jgi:hypothetical protein
MATSVIDHPVLPEDANILATGDHLVNLNNLGQAAQERLRLRERRITELELRGEIKPGTILNRSPFTLRVESGLIQYTVPPRPKGKPFSILTITGTRSFPIYRGNQEMSDKSLRGKYDVKVLLPVEQLMEFKHTYIGETEEDRLVKAGGVIIFEGDMEGVTPKSTVRVPEFVFRKGERYLRFRDQLLKELIDEADAQMKNRCMAVLIQADTWADDPKTRANIQDNERIWADFAFEQQWIPAARAWRNTVIRPEDSCPRCNAQYVSKTGMCKCSYVVNPLLAYMSGEIAVDHVRLNTLSAEDWKKVNAEQKRRDDARK